MQSLSMVFSKCQLQKPAITSTSGLGPA